ncbi:MAG: DM13 domain-containing protein [Chloroflexota bacterium]
MKRNQTIFIAIGVVLLAIIAIPLARPLFVNETVDEAFPFSTMTEEEQAGFAAMPQEQQDMLIAMSEENMEMAEANVRAMLEEDTVMEDDMPAEEPTALSEGSFIEIDFVHRGEGTATIYELPDGSNVLRFEDFRVTNGPDLHVLLVQNPDPRTRDDVGESGTGYIDLGQLSGNVGNQNYEIPADVDLSEYNSIVIYCMPFHVVFSVATLGEVEMATALPLQAEREFMLTSNMAPAQQTETEEPVEEETEPMTLFSGIFQSAGRGYSGEGGVQLIENPDGSRSLTLDSDFSVSRGPELFVYLVTTDNPSGTDFENAVDLGRLIKRSGTQTYDIPDDVDLSLYTHVLIYCEPFTVVFSFAELAPADAPLTGMFAGAGRGYQGGGTATLTPQEDGTALLEFGDDFTVTDGPQLIVLLSTAEAPTNRRSLGEYISLGALTSVAGSQSYIIPEDVDLSLYNSVVIYCEPFHVLFSVAPLATS